MCCFLVLTDVNSNNCTTGPLGLELQPLLKLNHISLGCLVKGWRDEPKVSEIIPNSKILYVDGVMMEELPFEDVVEKIRCSSERKIVLELPPDLRTKKDMSSVLIQSRENCNPNTFDVSMSDTVSKLPTSYDHIESVNSKKQQFVDSTPLTSCSVVDENNDNINKMSLLRQEVEHAKKDVLNFKNERRDYEGKITFLKYQLDKLKGTGKYNDDFAKDVNVAEKFQWLRHWNLFKPALNGIKNISSMNSWTDEASGVNLNVSSDKDITLKKELYAQRRINFRLEMQMRAWVDSQINLQKSLAREETEKHFSDVQDEGEGGESADQDVSDDDRGADNCKTNLCEYNESPMKEVTIVERPVIFPTDNVSRMKSKIEESTLTTAKIASDTSFFCGDYLPPNEDMSIKKSPDISAKLSSPTDRYDNWNSFVCSPELHTTNCYYHFNSISSTVSKKKSGECSEKTLLSPQEYRKILGSQEKTRQRSSNVSLADTMQQNSYNTLDKNSTSYITRNPTFRDHTRLFSKVESCHQNPPTRYSRNLRESSLSSQHTTYSKFSSISSEQNQRSRLLNDRMVRMKIESDKIRDDLRRFRNTMQEVRRECTI